MRMKQKNIIYKYLNKTWEAGSQGATLLVDLDLAFRFSSLFLPQVVTIASCNWFRKREYPAKPLPKPKSLATLSLAHARIRTQGTGERQLAVSVNALDHAAIKAGLVQSDIR